MAELNEQFGDRDTDRNSNNDTSAIRAEIEETRVRMSETLDEIGSRLNPHVVKEQVTQRVKEGIRDATIGRVEHMAKQAVDKVNETRYTLADTIRENPVPAAMVAIGLGWLMVNSRSSSASADLRSSLGNRQSAGYGLSGFATEGSYRGDYDAGYSGQYGDMHEGKVDRARERMHELADSARDRVSHVADSARDRVSGIADETRERVSDAAETARVRAGELAGRARETADSVRHRAHDLANSAAATTRQTAARVEDMYHENPLALGAVTLALGVAAGLAAPRTDREVQFFGDTRDQVVDRVKDVAEETKEKVQHVASRVMNEAKVAAREEGLPGT